MLLLLSPIAETEMFTAVKVALFQKDTLLYQPKVDIRFALKLLLEYMLNKYRTLLPSKPDPMSSFLGLLYG